MVNPSHPTEYHGVDELQHMARAGRYIDWTFRQVEPWLGCRVLEVGGGIGTYTELISQDNRTVLATEVARNCLDILAARFDKHANVSVNSADVSTEDGVREIMAEWEPFDSIVCMNVLEHIEDDAAALRNLGRVLRPGGILCLMVPMCPLAYGPLDRHLGHCRRYRRPPLRALVEEAGFRVVEDYYFNALGLLGWIFVTRICRRDRITVKQVLTYDRWYLPFVRGIERRIRPLFGQSLFLFAERV